LVSLSPDPQALSDTITKTIRDQLKNIGRIFFIILLSDTLPIDEKKYSQRV